MSINNDMIAALCAGTLTAGAGHPLDLLRTRLISGSNPRGFAVKRGLPFTLSLSVVKGGCVWPIQAHLKEFFDSASMSPFQATLFSGVVSNILPNAIFSPPSVVKIHIMRDLTSTPYIQVARNIYQTLGVKGFYNGLPATLFRDMAWGGLYFPTVRFLRGKVKAHSPNMNETMADLLAIFSSAVLATTPTAWIENVRIWQMNADRGPVKPLPTLIKAALAPTRPNLRTTGLAIARLSFGVSLGHTSYEHIRRSLEARK